MAAAVAAVNRQVHASSLPERYATLFYGVLDGQKRTLRYVNAGHNSPVVVRRDNSVVWLETGGAPVGMFCDWVYKEGIVQLNRGDLVVAYTDGVIEAVNPTGKEWGVEGLLAAVARGEPKHAEDIVELVFGAMDEFSAGCQTDDATVIALRMH